VRFFGPDSRAAMVLLKESAPGGARTCKAREGGASMSWATF
jgi:hypothetical protein